jgi:hypothetical protein
MSKEKYERALNDNRIIFGKAGKTKPQYKRFENEAREKGVNSFTIWDFVDTATKGTKELMKLFNGKKFATPKPEKLLSTLLLIPPLSKSKLSNNSPSFLTVNYPHSHQKRRPSA